ncbi:hypothetical protein KKP04_14380 [Rhodomicrobium sp. Az07]|uniref:hypothetical protein n=1 Tax=Rhodomicrobium sp. Az07 TaxID=2839034 RepID=UPI001BEB2B5D|nr:hypothetical protein [Rhodomicrobium sp. Az07]MBT3072044.1 hypothetical protein [Rhodomicrobium sp. Az07]
MSSDVARIYAFRAEVAKDASKISGELRDEMHSLVRNVLDDERLRKLKAARVSPNRLQRELEATSKAIIQSAIDITSNKLIGWRRALEQKESAEPWRSLCSRAAADKKIGLLSDKLFAASINELPIDWSYSTPSVEPTSASLSFAIGGASLAFCVSILFPWQRPILSALAMAVPGAVLGLTLSSFKKSGALAGDAIDFVFRKLAKDLEIALDAALIRINDEIDNAVKAWCTAVEDNLNNLS